MQFKSTYEKAHEYDGVMSDKPQGVLNQILINSSLKDSEHKNVVTKCMNAKSATKLINHKQEHSSINRFFCNYFCKEFIFKR